MYVLRFIYRNLDHLRARFLLMLFIGALDGAVIFFIPVILSEFTKSADISVDVFKQLVFYLTALYLTSLVLQWLLRKYGEALSAQFQHYLRSKYLDILDNMKTQDVSKHHSGYTLSLINRVADGMTPIINGLLWSFAKGIIIVVLFLLFTARESVVVGLLNAIVLLVFIVLGAVLSKKIVPLARDLNIKTASLLERYVDFLANMITVKKLGIGSFVRSIIDEKTRITNKQIRVVQNFHANRWLVLHSLYGIVLVGTTSYLLWDIVQGNTSPSILILFVAAYQLIRGHVDRFTEMVKTLMEMRAYIKNLDDIVYIEDQYADMPKHWNRIVLKNVKHCFEDHNKTIHIPEFIINKGDKICVSGESGQGKTTLLNVLANFIVPTSGELFVDSNPYEHIGSGFFVHTCAFVSQDVELFNLSLRDNLLLGKNITDDELVSVLQEVKLDYWVHGLKNGLDTVVGEKGIKLSAGQKQRINLVRSVLMDKDIYLLDEPTSHLDAETERYVIEFLKKHLKNKTVVIVSHKTSIRALCNTYYVMRNNTLMKE